jgi:hypothetical protein
MPGLARHLRQNVVGYIALFVALTGTSYAAVKLPANSVTTQQVKNHSLLKQDFKRGQLPRGPRGLQGLRGVQGLQGVQGPQGAAGANGATSVVIRIGAPAAAPSPSRLITASASCNPGERATGGGLTTSQDLVMNQPDDTISYVGPAPTLLTPIEAGTVPTRWVAQLYDVNGNDTASDTVTAYVVCAAQ